MSPDEEGMETFLLEGVVVNIFCSYLESIVLIKQKLSTIAVVEQASLPVLFLRANGQARMPAPQLQWPLLLNNCYI